MVTEKQWKVIRWIEQNLGIEFKGHWKEQATVFIERNIEQSKRVAHEHWLLTRELYATYHEDEGYEVDDDMYYGWNMYDFM